MEEITILDQSVNQDKKKKNVHFEYFKDLENSDEDIDEDD
jgi:hypothetical protein